MLTSSLIAGGGARPIAPDLDLTNVPTVKAILTRHNFAVSKRLGQNFLIDRNALEALVSAAHVEGEAAIEVGPGLGVLTRELADRAASVVAIEVATRLEPILAESLGARKNVGILFADFLHVPAETFSGGPYILASNLPYAITTPTLFRFLDGEIDWKRIVVTVQAELAERLAARPGTHEYGALTIAAQSAASVSLVRRIPSSSFWPRPKVASAVVALEPRSGPRIPRLLLRDILRHAFSSRRKTLRNALGRIEGAVDLAVSLGISAEARPERVTVDEWTALARALSTLGPSEAPDGARAVGGPHVSERKAGRRPSFERDNSRGRRE
jgi:16S rRNA (adenine1518-N6/adenine1519-N6)-dimethyltransferase